MRLCIDYSECVAFRPLCSHCFYSDYRNINYCARAGGPVSKGDQMKEAPMYEQQSANAGVGENTKLTFCNETGSFNVIDLGYKELASVLFDAFSQASLGKGKERHASGESFHDQPICAIDRDVGGGFCRGQAIKKILESQRLPIEVAEQELLGAINYLAAEILRRRETNKNEKLRGTD
jgi:hypothetical protein